MELVLSQDVSKNTGLNFAVFAPAVLTGVTITKYSMVYLMLQRPGETIRSYLTKLNRSNWFLLIISQFINFLLNY